MDTIDYGEKIKIVNIIEDNYINDGISEIPWPRNYILECDFWEIEYLNTFMNINNIRKIINGSKTSNQWIVSII